MRLFRSIVCVVTLSAPPPRPNPPNLTKRQTITESSMAASKSEAKGELVEQTSPVPVSPESPRVVDQVADQTPQKQDLADVDSKVADDAGKPADDLELEEPKLDSLDVAEDLADASVSSPVELHPSEPLPDTAMHDVEDLRTVQGEHSR